MKIETKYEINQKVWFIYESKAFEKPIHSIKIEIESNNIILKYWFNTNNEGSYNFISLYETQVFESKQVLIDNL